MDTLSQLRKLSIRKPMQTTTATYNIKVETDEGIASFHEDNAHQTKNIEGHQIAESKVI